MIERVGESRPPTDPFVTRSPFPKPAVPRPAATLVLARDGDAGVEVLMLKRTQGAAFARGAYVFPGGAIDPADSGAAMLACCAGLDDAAASACLGVPTGGLGAWVAAIRECFEEAGVLLAYGADGRLVAPDGGANGSALADARRAVLESAASFDDFIVRAGWKLAADRLVYLGRWVTQQNRPRRFDAHFFVAAAPEGQLASFDGFETVDQAWVRPADALARHGEGEIELLYPTIKTLQSLTGFASVAALLATMRARPPVDPGPTWIAEDHDGRREVYQADFAYAEVKKLDPERTGRARCVIDPGRVVRLAPRVRRVTAPNPSAMTGPGTNTYLVGNRELAIVDPGPELDVHLEAILAAIGDARVRWILCTHTHIDHSPLARVLAERTGGRLGGLPPPAAGRQDATFAPEWVPADGERLRLEDFNLRAIHTPGHASNQVCWLLEEERMLFTGDHVMQGSTVVIPPPDGHMATYLRMLATLPLDEIDHFAPGHGFLMGDPAEQIDRLLIHRGDRERKIVNTLRRVGPVTLEALLPAAYDDTPERMHPVAAGSLRAHLDKLAEEGRARESGGVWSLVAPAARA
jgi:glyoxylase-like metal-dependent hydrolase (beta-lactamase superfamily II)/8-oxo-dGTP pyrophosphatase MutT (NUDIX family)